jgi:hypothetical protein
VTLAAAQRCLPSSVRGPVDLPPCARQTAFPVMAGALHLSFVRLDRALHWRQTMRPPAVMSCCMLHSVFAVERTGLALFRTGPHEPRNITSYPWSHLGANRCLKKRGRSLVTAYKGGGRAGAIRPTSIVRTTAAPRCRDVSHEVSGITATS